MTITGYAMISYVGFKGNLGSLKWSLSFCLRSYPNKSVSIRVEIIILYLSWYESTVAGRAEPLVVVDDQFAAAEGEDGPAAERETLIGSPTRRFV